MNQRLLTEETLALLRSIFDEIANPLDKCMSFQNLQTITSKFDCPLTALELENALSSAEQRNSEGRITFENFCAIMTWPLDCDDVKHGITRAYEELDANHDGNVDAIDLLKTSHKFGEKFQLAEAQMMVEQADNNNGTIDLDVIQDVFEKMR